MGNGSTVKIFKKNLHRTNAKQVLEESIQSKEHIKKLLIAFASMGKTFDTSEECHLEDYASKIVYAIDGFLEEYADACTGELLAANMIDCPEDCEDDYDGESIGDKPTEGNEIS